jgi:20S proteasome alpha/beta subunit
VTVVVGFIGPKGAVMASDSQGSEADQTQHEVEKIWEDTGLLFGYSGMMAVRDPLRLSIAGKLKSFADKKLSRWEVKDLLHQATLPVLKNAYGNYVGTTEGEDARRMAGAMIVIGHDDENYWLLEIDHNNIGSFYNETAFHTVGSGSVAAQVARGLMQPYEPKGRSVGHLRLLAYRTVSTCIDVLGGGFGVGGTPQVWASEDGGPFTKLTDDELAALENDVGGWVLVEKESLDAAFPNNESAQETAVSSEADELPAKKQG